jgi:hypothetical protein
MAGNIQQMGRYRDLSRDGEDIETHSILELQKTSERMVLIVSNKI